MRPDDSMTPDTQQNVTESVWPWRSRQNGPSGAGKQAKPHMRVIVIQALGMVGLGLFLQRILDRPIMACIVSCWAAVLLMSALFLPPVFRAIERFGLVLARGASIALTWALLVPLFYLFFVPGRIFRSLTGTDPLTRKCPTDQTTYWVPHQPIRDIEQYRKQH